MVNGHDAIESPLAIASRRLTKAVMSLQLTPPSAGISGFVNGVLVSARVDALADVLVNPPNSTWTMQEAIDALTAKHMDLKAEEMESAALRMQLEGKDAGAKLVMPGH